MSEKPELKLPTFKKFEDYSLKFFSVIDSTRKSGRVTMSKDEITKFLIYIDIINLVTVNTSHIGGEDLERIFIPEQLKSMIYPKAIGFGNVNYRIIDHLQRPDTTHSMDEFDNTEFNELRDKFCANFKLVGEASLLSVRSIKDQSFDLTANFEDVAFNNKIRSGHELTIPVPVTSSFKYKDDLFYTEDVKDIIIEAFRSICNNLNTRK